jgi:hypothetical protein
VPLLAISTVLPDSHNRQQFYVKYYNPSGEPSVEKRGEHGTIRDFYVWDLNVWDVYAWDIYFRDSRPFP